MVILSFLVQEHMCGNGKRKIHLKYDGSVSEGGILIFLFRHGVQCSVMTPGDNSIYMAPHVTSHFSCENQNLKI